MTDTVRSGGAASRGSSGAVFDRDIHDDRIIWKHGPSGETRVSDQGAYIMSFGETVALPRIDCVWSALNSYAMERLDNPSPLRMYDAGRLVTEYMIELERGIWCHEPVVNLDRDAHIRKLMTILPSEDWEDVYRTFDSIDWRRDIRRCKTHGDPTFDNLMFRGEQLIIIDPIPPTPAVPDLMAVDLGKILQSLMGFEFARYGVGGPTHRDDAIEILKNIVNNEYEWEAAWYWCAVHFYRAVPYMPEEVKPDVLALARSAVSYPYGL